MKTPSLLSVLAKHLPSIRGSTDESRARATQIAVAATLDAPIAQLDADTRRRWTRELLQAAPAQEDPAWAEAWAHWGEHAQMWASPSGSRSGPMLGWDAAIAAIDAVNPRALAALLAAPGAPDGAALTRHRAWSHPFKQKKFHTATGVQVGPRLGDRLKGPWSLLGYAVAQSAWRSNPRDQPQRVAQQGQIVKVLVSAGVDINAPCCALGWPAVALAQSPDALGALFEAGADPHARLPDGTVAAAGLWEGAWVDAKRSATTALGWSHRLRAGPAPALPQSWDGWVESFLRSLPRTVHDNVRQADLRECWNTVVAVAGAAGHDLGQPGPDGSTGAGRFVHHLLLAGDGSHLAKIDESLGPGRWLPQLLSGWTPGELEGVSETTWMVLCQALAVGTAAPLGRAFGKDNQVALTGAQSRASALAQVPAAWGSMARTDVGLIRAWASASALQRSVPFATREQWWTALGHATVAAWQRWPEEGAHRFWREWNGQAGPLKKDLTERLAQWTTAPTGPPDPVAVTVLAGLTQSLAALEAWFARVAPPLDPAQQTAVAHVAHHCAHHSPSQEGAARWRALAYQQGWIAPPRPALKVRL